MEPWATTTDSRSTFSFPMLEQPCPCFGTTGTHPKYFPVIHSAISGNLDTFKYSGVSELQNSLLFEWLKSNMIGQWPGGRVIGPKLDDQINKIKRTKKYDLRTKN